jgi:hypothetical protein
MRRVLFTSLFITFFMVGNLSAQHEEKMPALDNPISVQYLKKNETREIVPHHSHNINP